MNWSSGQIIISNKRLFQLIILRLFMLFQLFRNNIFSRGIQNENFSTNIIGSIWKNWYWCTWRFDVYFQRHKWIEQSAQLWIEIFRMKLTFDSFTDFDILIISLIMCCFIHWLNDMKSCWRYSVRIEREISNSFFWKFVIVF